MITRTMIVLVTVGVTLMFSASVFYLCYEMFALDNQISLIIAGIFEMFMMYLIIGFMASEIKDADKRMSEKKV